jgi:hypothetical protein
MAARRRSSGGAGSSSSFFNKDLFIFVIIIAIVAYVTYILTYNAITAKFDQQIGNTKNPATYQLLPPTQ